MSSSITDLNETHKHDDASSAGAMGVPRAMQIDFEKEQKKIENFENINKKFHKDVKAYIDRLDELKKNETKMIGDLDNFIGQALMTSTSVGEAEIETTATNETDFKEKFQLWRDILVHHNTSCETLKQSCQSKVIEPIKKLNNLFPNVYSAIKRRDQALSEYIKQKAKLEKLQERERTGANVVKIEELKQQVNASKQQFFKEHVFLMEELPKLYNSRLEYIKPCVNSLLESQSSFYENYASYYEKILANSNSTGSVDKLDAEINEYLSKIKELSIVAGD